MIEPDEEWQRVRPRRFIIADLTEMNPPATDSVATNDFLSKFVKFIESLFTIDFMPKNFINTKHFGDVSVDYMNTYVPTPIQASRALSNPVYEFAKGKQNVAIVFMMLACGRLPSVEWEQLLLDQILLAGTRLYLCVRERNSKPHRRHRKLEEFTDVKMGQYVFKATVDESNEPCESVGDFLWSAQSSLDNGKPVSFLVAESFYGIFKQTKVIRGAEVTVYMLFDSRGIFGWQLPGKEPEEPLPDEAKAILLEFDDLDDLVNHVYRTLFVWDKSITADQLNLMPFPKVHLYAYSIEVDTTGTATAKFDVSDSRHNKLRLSPAKKVRFVFGRMKDTYLL